MSRSLVRPGEGPDGEPRLVMLETIRELALERLAAQGEEDDARRAHAAHYLALAEAAEPRLMGREQRSWLDRLETEHDNLRAALGWAVAAGETETGLRLVAALRFFWMRRGHMREGIRWAARFRLDDPAAYHDAPPAVAARAVLATAALVSSIGGPGPAVALYRRSIALARQGGDVAGAARTLNVLGFSLAEADDPAAALAPLAEAAVLFGDLPGAEIFAAQNLGLRAIALMGLGDPEEAAGLAARAVDWQRALGNGWGLSQALDVLGEVRLRQGDAADAAALQLEAAEVALADDDQWHLARALAGYAVAVAALGRAGEAVRVAGALDASNAVTGERIRQRRQAMWDAALAGAEAALGPEAFAAARAAGRAVSLEAVVAEARQHPPESAPRGSDAAASISTPGDPAGLTKREAEVLRLVARGWDNRRIGDALSISHRTVGVHVGNILGKLDVETRAAAVAWAHRNGLG